MVALECWSQRYVSTSVFQHGTQLSIKTADSVSPRSQLNHKWVHTRHGTEWWHTMEQGSNLGIYKPVTDELWGQDKLSSHKARVGFLLCGTFFFPLFTWATQAHLKVSDRSHFLKVLPCLTRSNSHYMLSYVAQESLLHTTYHGQGLHLIVWLCDWHFYPHETVLSLLVAGTICICKTTESPLPVQIPNTYLSDRRIKGSVPMTAANTHKADSQRPFPALQMLFINKLGHADHNTHEVSQCRGHKKLRSVLRASFVSYLLLLQLNFLDEQVSP